MFAFVISWRPINKCAAARCPKPKALIDFAEQDARHFMHGLVLSPKFELIFDILIVANTVAGCGLACPRIRHVGVGLQDQLVCALLSWRFNTHNAKEPLENQT